MPLVLSGSRAQPDAQAVSLALAVPDSFASWRSSIETVLFEHLAPYAEAIAAWEEPSPAEPLLIISTPSQVWPLVSFLFVSVTPLGGVLTTEIGLRVVWDEEHTLGARFQAGKFLELCGSVLSP